MTKPCLNLAGQKYGRLLVIRRVAPRTFSNGQRQSQFECLCDCGNLAIVLLSNLRGGNTSSCGCVAREILMERNTTHGMTYTSERRIWNQMHQRCRNPNTKFYSDYGGRGIRVCDEWRDFVAFYRDMGPRPSTRHTIERTDNNGNYEPGNCVWATRQRQANNRRSNHRLAFNGLDLTLAEWSRRLNHHPTLIRQRLARGWSPERALMTPSRRPLADQIPPARPSAPVQQPPR